MTAPWLDDGDVRLYHGDALAVLRSLPERSVQCCVTSPPYWGLRDYQAAGQLGLEATPDLYVANMVAVFREVRRVLRDDGTLWLNLGDSYASGNGGDTRSGFNERYHGTVSAVDKQGATNAQLPVRERPPGMKPKDLCGIPWRIAFALQADGWYLRSDIVWSKPNPMPESVTDRPTKAHEYVFLLSKQPRYYYDLEAIRQPVSDNWQHAAGAPMPERGAHVLKSGSNGHQAKRVYDVAKGANARSVWEIATQPTPEAHFATFPEALARRCILAGTSERGECSACGAPWIRDIVRTPDPRVPYRTQGTGAQAHEAGRNDGLGARKVLREDGRGGDLATARVEQVGWRPSCVHANPPVPQLVLDPFIGSGTTALVARKHARHAIGIDLSAEYLAIAARRLSQQSLFSPAIAPAVEPEAEVM